MQNKYMLQIPSDEELSRIEGWIPVGNNEYQAFRNHLIVIKRRDNTAKTSPPLVPIELPPGAGYRFETKKIKSIKHNESIQQSIKSAVTTKLFSELSSKFASEMGVGTDFSVLSGKLSKEIQVKSGIELTELIERQLSGISSFEIENREEIINAFSIEPSDQSDDKSRLLYIFLMLWPWHIDFYLYKVEFLRLKYEKKRRFFFW